MLSQDKCQFSSEYLTYFKELYFHHYSSDWNFGSYTCFSIYKETFSKVYSCYKRDKEHTSLGGSGGVPGVSLVWTKLFQRVILDLPLSLVTIECCTLIISWNLTGLNFGK